MRNPFINALPVYANALASQTGVKVVYGADMTCTDHETVYVTAANSEDPSQRAMTIGKVAHEIGHVKHSDAAILPTMTPLDRMFRDVLEDIYIEGKMKAEFPGVSSDLATMVSELVKEGFFATPQEEESAASMIQAYMLYSLRSEVLGQTVLSDFAAEAKAFLASKIPQGAMVKLEALMFQVCDCENSHEVLELAREIIKMLGDEAKKEEEEKKQQQAQQQADGSNDQPAGGDQPDSPGQSGGDDGDGMGDGSVDEQTGLQEILGAGESDIKEDVGSYLSRKLDQNAAASDDKTNVSPFDFQGLKPKAMGNIDAEKNRVSAATNALKVRAQAMLQTQTLATRHSSLTGMHLNVSSLYRANLDGRVFEKVKEGIKIDTAIFMLVDISTSMNEGAIRLASDAALATTLAFDRPGIKTAVAAFPYFEKCAVVKTWDMQPAAAIPCYLELRPNGTTPMAEAMMAAGIELMKRREKRKILFVNTDGAPDNIGKANWVVDIARNGGIQVMGLGIACDASKVFGASNSRRIASIAELPSAMVGMLESAMA